MKTKTLVRFEHPSDGFGIFFREGDDPLHLSNIPLVSVEDRHNDSFPTPIREDLDLDKNGKEWFCAYTSVDQLKEWINTDEIRVLVECGHRIYMLEVSEYQMGVKQGIYTKESIVSKNDITNIFLN